MYNSSSDCLCVLLGCGYSCVTGNREENKIATKIARSPIANIQRASQFDLIGRVGVRGRSWRSFSFGRWWRARSISTLSPVSSTF